MANGQSFDDFLSEELAGQPELVSELDEAFEDIHLAAQLAVYRESRGMSQQDLAHASGIQQPMISRIERGDQQPTWPTLRKLLQGLNVSLIAMPNGKVTLMPAEGPALYIEPAAFTAATTRPDLDALRGRILAALEAPRDLEVHPRYESNFPGFHITLGHGGAASSVPWAPWPSYPQGPSSFSSSWQPGDITRAGNETATGTRGHEVRVAVDTLEEHLAALLLSRSVADASTALRRRDSMDSNTVLPRMVDPTSVLTWSGVEVPVGTTKLVTQPRVA